MANSNKECVNPKCENELPEDSDTLCDECNPSEQEIKEAKEWAENYLGKWNKLMDKLDEEIKECEDCELPEDESKDLCDRHRARGMLAFTGGNTKDIEEDLASLEMRLDEEVDKIE